MLLLVTQCPTEGFVAELPFSMPRLELSGHIPDPTKTSVNPLPCVLEEKAGDYFSIVLLMNFPLCHQDPLSHEDPESTCSTLKSLTQRNSLTRLQRSSTFHHSKCQQVSLFKVKKGRAKLGLWKGGRHDSISLASGTAPV